MDAMAQLGWAVIWFLAGFGIRSLLIEGTHLLDR